MHCRSIISSIRIERLAISDTNLKQVGEIHKYFVVGSPTQLQQNRLLVKLDHFPKVRGENFENVWVATNQTNTKLKGRDVILSKFNKTTTPFFWGF